MVKMDVVVVEEVDVGVFITTIFPHTYARMHYVHLRARVLTPEVKLVNTNEEDASAARQTVRVPREFHGVYFTKTQ